MNLSNKFHIDLKPCPFCGGKAAVYSHGAYDYGYDECYVMCKSCRAQTPHMTVAIRSEGMASVQALWNKRHHTTTTNEEQA